MEFVIFILVLVALDLAALNWGVDSSEKLDSSEWCRRLDQQLTQH